MNNYYKDFNILQKNLKHLRKQYNETQKLLSKEFRIGQSTLSDYECGKKPIPVDFLCNISNRYNVTLDDLIKKDLSLECFLPRKIDRDFVIELSGALLPSFTSKKAMNNENYKKAMNIIDSFNNLDFVGEKNVLVSYVIELFQKSWDETKNYATILNNLSFMLAVYDSYNQQSIQYYKELETSGYVRFDTFFVNCSTSNIVEHKSIKQKEFYDKYKAVVYNNIKLLKNNLYFMEIGDYYLALCYIFDFCEDDDYILNLKTGINMFEQLCQIGNKYAVKLVNRFSKIL